MKLKCDVPLSNFAFSFNLRRYNMAQLSTANQSCPTAVIEPIRGRANVQFLFRIYGQGASADGRVQFKWSMAGA